MDKEHNGGRVHVWAGATAVLLVLYVLSIGPAWRAWRLGMLPLDPIIIDTFYFPLEQGARRLGLYEELDAYMTLFDP
jgi:hypothetical protein